MTILFIYNFFFISMRRETSGKYSVIIFEIYIINLVHKSLAISQDRFFFSFFSLLWNFNNTSSCTSFIPNDYLFSLLLTGFSPSLFKWKGFSMTRVLAEVLLNIIINIVFHTHTSFEWIEMGNDAFTYVIFGDTISIIISCFTMLIICK